VAQGRTGEAQPRSRSHETLRLGHGDESGQLGEVAPLTIVVSCSTRHADYI
jgi:hypothetical protein